MKKPIIVTKVKVTQYNAILALALRVYDGVHLNPHFVNPQPSLSVLLAGTAELRSAIERWGTTGNRGSHADYVNLKLAAARLHKMLTQLAAWCMSTLNTGLDFTEQEAILATAGYALKGDRTPQGRLEMVQDLHLFIARNIPQGYIKMRWKKPLNVTTHTNVKGYLIYRSATNEFSTAAVIASVTKTMFTEAPGIGTWFYWVVATNTMGNGVVGSSLMAEVFKQAQY